MVNRPYHMTEAERDECIRLYLDWETLDALAERYDRSRNTIQRLVRVRGVQRGRWVDPNPNSYCLAQRRCRARKKLEQTLVSAL